MIIRRHFRVFALTVAAGLMASCLLATAARAQEQTYRFDIPAQDLGSALRAFGQAAKQQIIFAEDTVRGERSAPLVGRYPADEALHHLIAATDIKVHQNDSGMIVLGDDTIPGANNAQPARRGNTAVAEPAAASESDPIATEPAGNAKSQKADTQVNPTTADVEEIVVTGSRIKQTLNETAAPLSSFTKDAMTERGFTQVGDMLNLITSNSPTFQVAPFAGYPVVTAGRQSPNLFNLGAGRTLSLINGRRMVASSSAFSDSAVDTNVIPVELIERVDIVEAGGAAVYGSGAIAGVVNYVLKRDFQGLSLDAQYGLSSRGDYRQPSLRLTAGQNFHDNRGNIAVNLEYSSSSALFYKDRPWSARAHSTVANLEDTGPDDGIPSSRNIYDATFYGYNSQGIIYRNVFGPTGPVFSSDPSRMISLNGTPLQFAPDGSVVPYDPGTIQSSSFASGGQGFPLIDRSTLYGGTKRWSGTVLSHYDFSDTFRLSGELIYGHQVGLDPIGGGNMFRLMGSRPFTTSWALGFNRDNPFLSPQAITTLSAASSAFAGGGTVYLSKVFFNVLPSRERTSETDTWRGVVSLDGDFSVADRDLYYSLSFSHAETDAVGSSWQQSTDHWVASLSATRNAAGEIVCSINADGDAANDDPACVPIDPFSTNPISDEAQDYVAVLSGLTSRNKQDDFIASVGGSLLSVPGGEVKFSLAYEHRRESALDMPFAADLQGLPFNDFDVPQSGSYNTNEYSAELAVPLVGGDFTLPLVKAFELNGSIRHVDNSLAGKQNVWGLGARWEVGGGLFLRGTRSRNFRAPSLSQLFAPSSTSPAAIFYDPCSRSNIDEGPVPATRRANCEALFAENPAYGPLADFQDQAEGTAIAFVTTGGNPNLRNEISNTRTFGAVWEPDYVRGLSAAIDVISVNLTDGLVQFTPASFFVKCYDTSPQDPQACSTFTRDPDTGFMATALSGFTNAGYIKVRAETYELNYVLPLERLFSSNLGAVRLGFEATHMSRYEQSDTGFKVDAVRRDGTSAYPDWRMRFDLNYDRGPFGVFYSLSYYPSQKSGFYDTIETTPNPKIEANSVSSISARYAFDYLSLRAGVTNIFDEAPSFPTFTYGDALGRRFFVGADLQF